MKSSHELTRSAGQTSTTFWLKPVPPFRLDLTAWALRRRLANVIDRWDGETYRRVLSVDDTPVEVAVRQTGAPDAARLRVTITAPLLPTGAKLTVTAALERLLGLRIDLRPFYEMARSDRHLGPLADQFRGMKPPRFPTLFEALTNAVACQQMSLSLGILLLSRLAERFGLSADSPTGTAFAFPRPADLAEVEPSRFRELGFSLQKGRSLTALARSFQESGRWEGLAKLESDTVVERLRELRGIGRWSAEYALLRGLGRLEVYPGDDVGARNNLTRWLKLRKPLDYAGVRRVTARWQPYAGLVYFHLLLDRLTSAGHLPASSTEPGSPDPSESHHEP